MVDHPYHLCRIGSFVVVLRSIDPRCYRMVQREQGSYSLLLPLGTVRPLPSIPVIRTEDGADWARGFITRKWKSPEDIPENSFQKMVPRFQGEAFYENLKIVDELDRIAKEKGLETSQLALAWVISLSPYVSPISLNWNQRTSRNGSPRNGSQLMVSSRTSRFLVRRMQRGSNRIPKLPPSSSRTMI